MKITVNKTLIITLDDKSDCRNLFDEIIKIEKIVAERFQATDPERFERECPLLATIQARIIEDIFEKDSYHD